MKDGYVTLVWPTDSRLTAQEQACVEEQRRQLWEEGVTREPSLTEMAFLFAAVLVSEKVPR